MSWLKDCEVCNAGLCATVDRLKREGKAEREAARAMSEESGGLYSAEAILQRYRYHTGKVKRASCESHTGDVASLKDEAAMLHLILDGVDNLEPEWGLRVCLQVRDRALALAQEAAERQLRAMRKLGEISNELERLITERPCCESKACMKGDRLNFQHVIGCKDRMRCPAFGMTCSHDFDCLHGDGVNETLLASCLEEAHGQ